MNTRPTYNELLQEVSSLRAAVAESDEILAAIRNGEVDAVLALGPQGEQLFALRGVDDPYRVLIEEMNQGAVTLSADGVILYCNRRFFELVKTPREEVTGVPFANLVAPSEREDFAALLAAGLSGGSAAEITLCDGHRQPVPLQLALATLPATSEAAICLIATDISESREKETRLRETMKALVATEQVAERARSEAEKANATKGEFLANVSHEIRTPMNGIIGMTDLALETDLQPEQREYLSMVKSSAYSLLGLINDILDFSKIEAGKLTLEAIDFDLRECIAGFLRPLAIRAEQKSLELTLDIAEAVPELLVGDPLRLQQILVNLIDNAIKFTPQGDVMVDISLEPATGDEHCLHFQVADTGSGIPLEKQALIFEAFAQADGTTTRTHGGTGLGLAIASQLVHQMGGKIWVESSEGKGTTFHFTARLPAQEARLQSGVVADPSPLGGLRVLIVDDNNASRRILHGMLARWGMKPTSVPSGLVALQEMLSAARTGAPFALALLDGAMPEMDGFAVAGEIRQHPELDCALVMMLSSLMPAGATARCQELQVASNLIKPVSRLELLDAMLIAAGGAAEMKHSASPIPPRTGGRLRILLAEDNAINQLLATGILEKQGHSLVSARTGEEAVALAAEGGFDLILMDVQMPKMDGLQATRLIRRSELTTGRHIPIVAMTAHAMVGDRERCLAAGMDDYLSKPLEKEVMLQMLERLCPRQLPMVPSATSLPATISSVDGSGRGRIPQNQRGVFLSALLSCLLSLSVLVGWAFDLRPAVSWRPEFAAMKPDAALSLLCCGVSMALFALRFSLWRRRFSIFFAGGALLLSLANLLQYATGSVLGLWPWLFRAFRSGSTFYHSDRLSPLASLGFVCLGGALVLLHWPKAKTAIHALVLFVAFISSLAVVGCFYGVDTLYRVGHFTAVGPLTALALLIVCAGVWCAAGRHGFTRIVMAGGSRGFLIRSYGVAALTLPFVFAWLRLQGEHWRWYTPALGSAAFVLIESATWAFLVWIGVRSLLAAEYNEAMSQTSLREVQLGLEQRVLERTAELVQAKSCLEEQVRQRSKAEHAYQQIMENSLDAICTFDKEGRFLQVSHACERLWGYPPGMLIGRPYLELVHPGDRAKTIEASEAIVKGGSTANFENRYQHLDGSTVPILWAAHWSEAQQTFFCVARDISGRKEIERELLSAKESAEAASRLKSEFLANMSHEIRTPMNGILRMTDLVLDSQLTREQRDYLSMAKTSAHTLLGLINNILDFSKIEAGKLDLEAFNFSLRSCLSSVLKPLGLRADQKGLELICDVPEEVPDHLVGDPTRLRQIIVNLVDNAIKFTEEGNVMLTVALGDEPGDGQCFHFSITDTGIGIPAAKQVLIFEAFTQADGSTTRTHGGTGLGLAICAELVRHMGGHIWVESTAGAGTTFHFTARAPVLPLPAPETSAADPRSLVGLRVLLVDDIAVNRRILSEMLAHWQMHPVAVATGAEALAEMLRAAGEGLPFPLVILDGMMPEMDGFMVAQQIQEHQELSGATVMMLSSAMGSGVAARCEDLGVASYLTKPISRAEMLEAILVAMGGVSVLASGSEEPLPTAPLEKMRILVVEDNAINHSLASALLKRCGHTVVSATNGRESLEAFSAMTFDVILMDVQMPEMDGLEATARMRELEQGSSRHTPIVAMTAHAMTGDRERCLAAGMDAYLPKPLDKRALLEVLSRFSLVRRGAAPGQPDTAAVSPVAPAFPPAIAEAPLLFSREKLLERVDGDEELLSRMTQMFQEGTPHALRGMRAAVEADDAGELARGAHALLSSLGIFGAQPAHRLTLQLESQANSGSLENSEATLTALESNVALIYEALAETVPV